MTHSASSSRVLGALALGALVAVGCTPEERPVPDAAASATAPRTDLVHGPAGLLHVDDGGSGAGIPVLFVHSFGGSSGHWASQLAHLRNGRRAVAFDLRAHGASAAPASMDYSVDAFASDIGAVADSLGLQRFVLVGHSLGGAAGLIYAGLHPDRVAGLMLVGTPGATLPEVSQPIIATLESDQYQHVMDDYMKKMTAGARPEVGSQVNEGLARLSREQSIAIIKATFAYDPTTALRAYPGPVLSLAAAAEQDTPTAIHNLAPTVTHKRMDGTSHWMQMDKPDEFNALLDAFLKGIR